jgi:MbtH protein
VDNGRDIDMPENGMFKVVVNDEEQYSIWPDGQELPPGWRGEGAVGSKEECLNHIDEVWVDMRPLSLRRTMAADNGA